MKEHACARWANLSENQLNEDELEECHRLWREHKRTCIEVMVHELFYGRGVDPEWSPPEEYQFDEAAWIDYCVWCNKMFGADPFS
jgi:hypothetical protein